MNTQNILLSTGMCFCLLALYPARKTLSQLGCALLLLSFFFFSLFRSEAGHARSPHQIIETSYNTLTIFDGNMHGRPARFMLTDPGSAQSASFLDKPEELTFEYTKFFQIGPFLHANATHVLMLGGGGYSVPKWLLSSKQPLPALQNLTVVELDPGISRAAQDFFFAPQNDSRLQIHHEDARRFINRTALQEPQTKKYDLIFADVFNSYYTVPFHMGTREAAQRLHQLLEKDGVLMMNIISSLEGENGRLFRSIYHAFAEVFPELLVLPVQQPQNGKNIQNIILLAFRTPHPFNALALQNVPPALRIFYQNRWGNPITQDVPPLMDKYAPVERYITGFFER